MCRGWYVTFATGCGGWYVIMTPGAGNVRKMSGWGVEKVTN